MSDPEYSLVMPFVTVASKGYECGQLDATLRDWGSAQTYENIFHEANLPQVDLLAMKYGFTADVAEAGEGWKYITFRKVGT